MFVKIDPETQLPIDVKPYNMIPKDEFSIKGLWQARADWQSFEEVEKIASHLTSITNKAFMAIDNTSSVWPQFDIIETPKVGDAVSYGFNGDYYPDGYIVSITQKMQITTSSGKKYRRYKNTSNWRSCGSRSWSLVQGHINERNPHF